MLSQIFATTVFVSTASFALADDQVQYWWSYKHDNSSNLGYEPEFEICGTSCDDCGPKAASCHSDDYSNICYEPTLGETCCNDAVGTSCYENFYCAYNSYDEAYCCEMDTDVEDCGKLLNVALTTADRTTKPMASTVVVTKMFTPTASNSIVPRPLRSRPAEITSFAGLHSGSHNSINLSNGAKIGISAGAAVVVAALVGLVIFCFLRRRRARKYRKIGGGSVDDKLAAHHLTPFQTHRGVPAPTHGAGTAFEPMRGEDSPEYRQEYKQPYMMSPPQRSSSPNKQPLMDSVELFRSSTSESPPRDIELSQVSPRLHASTAAQAPASANMELTHENDITHQRNPSPFASHSRGSS